MRVWGRTNRITLLLAVVMALFVGAVQADAYRVTGVESWDTLNMRAEPGSSSAVVTKIPHNGSGLLIQGASQKIGKTTWVKVSWQQHTGWVSQAYLEKMPSEAPASPEITASVPEPEKIDEPLPTPSEPAPGKTIQKEKVSGMWILECGNSSPFWKVEVLPEWMVGTLGQHKTGMPITHTHQEHGKYHKVALTTEIKGANKWNHLEMTLTYTRSCYNSLFKRKVPFQMTGTFNEEEISGCCRSMQVK